MSTSEDAQYIGGFRDLCGGYHDYIKGCSVRQRDIMSTSWLYHHSWGGGGGGGELIDKSLYIEHPLIYA